jgi:hypothetical protein
MQMTSRSLLLARGNDSLGYRAVELFDLFPGGEDVEFLTQLRTLHDAAAQRVGPLDVLDQLRSLVYRHPDIVRTTDPAMSGYSRIAAAC